MSSPPTEHNTITKQLRKIRRSSIVEVEEPDNLRPRNSESRDEYDEVNQKIADRNAAVAESNKTSVNKNNSIGNKTTQKQKPVEDIVKFIEGSSAGNKNKITKDRQKQDQKEAAKLQQEHEKRVQEAYMEKYNA